MSLSIQKIKRHQRKYQIFPPETKCQGLFSTPYISLHEKSHCRFLHNGYKVMFYSLLITGKLMPKLKFWRALHQFIS